MISLKEKKIVPITLNNSIQRLIYDKPYERDTKNGTYPGPVQRKIPALGQEQSLLKGEITKRLSVNHYSIICLIEEQERTNPKDIAINRLRRNEKPFYVESCLAFRKFRERLAFPASALAIPDEISFWGQVAI